MRILLIVVFSFSSFFVQAQKGYDRITISNFKQGFDRILVDSVQGAIRAGLFVDYISAEQVVYDAEKDINRYRKAKKILAQLSFNGTEHISTCFIPGHSINYYKDGKLVECILICFKCGGVKFSNEIWVTPVRSERKRLDLLTELESELFGQLKPVLDVPRQ